MQFRTERKQGLPGALIRLEELDRISVWILDLDLLGPTSLVPELNPSLLQCLNPSREVGHLKHNAIPSTRLLLTTIRQGPGTGSPGAAENQLQIVDRDLGECR